MNYEENNKKIIKASLAPMAGFTDTVFRRICARFGAVSAVSEMISAVALTRNDRKTAELARIDEGEAPTFLQIFGHDPKIMAEAAEILLSGSFSGCSYASPPAGIDINMGCPVKKIVTSGDGSSLMRDPELAARITSSVAEVCARHGVPLSVKFRSGWDSSSVIAPEFAVKMADAGADILTVHCRTREQMYAPFANPEIACKTALALGGRGVTLIGNGDVDSVESARTYIDGGCCGVSIGRAALGNPWLFRELLDPDSFTPPTIEEIRELIIEFVEDVVKVRGEEAGIRESRGRAAHFLRGMRGCAKMRDDLNHAVTLSEFTKILERLGTDA